MPREKSKRKTLKDESTGEAVELSGCFPRMGAMHTTNLPYSPYQNGKTERFWGILEGRLMAMLKNVEDISVKLLNDSTLAWVEQDYNRALNKEIGTTPYDLAPPSNVI